MNLPQRQRLSSESAKALIAYFAAQHQPHNVMRSVLNVKPVPDFVRGQLAAGLVSARELLEILDDGVSQEEAVNSYAGKVLFETVPFDVFDFVGTIPAPDYDRGFFYQRCEFARALVSDASAIEFTQGAR